MPLPTSRSLVQCLLRTLRAAIVCGVFAPAALLAQTISFTFDDGFDPRTDPQAATLNAQLLAALKQEGVQAMLFPAGKFVDSDQGLALVKAWGEQGHAIGNHTYSHHNFGSPQRPVEDFSADVLRAETLFKPLPGFEKRLRFPYLKEGDTAEQRDGLRRWLAQAGYETGAVSIDASDWYYDERFADWRGDRPASEWPRFVALYVQHLLDRAQYYDQLAVRLTGRHPAHTLLLHANTINALFFPRVAQAFRAHGWKIVSATTAFKDPLFAKRPQVTPAGESIVWSLAKEAGLPGLRYPAEDSVYEEPLLNKALK